MVIFCNKILVVACRRKVKKMKNFFALLVIIVFTAVNVYAEKMDLNTISDLQPCSLHSTAKKAPHAYKFSLRRGAKKHRGNSSFDRTDGIAFDDDAMIFEGSDSKNYSKPVIDMDSMALINISGSRACDMGGDLAYESITVSDLTNQQKK